MIRRHLLRTIMGASMALLPTVGLSADIMVTDAYARVARPNAPTGAAFMEITNSTGTADRLIEARSDVAKRVELHTHIEQGDGIMVMTRLEEGIAFGPGASHAMKRGGDHVMLMGLTMPLSQGDVIQVTLVFENAGEITVSIPVDNTRAPSHDHMSHGEGN